MAYRRKSQQYTGKYYCFPQAVYFSVAKQQDFFVIAADVYSQMRHNMLIYFAGRAHKNFGLFRPQQNKMPANVMRIILLFNFFFEYSYWGVLINSAFKMIALAF